MNRGEQKDYRHHDPDDPCDPDPKNPGVQVSVSGSDDYTTRAEYQLIYVQTLLEDENKGPQCSQNKKLPDNNLVRLLIDPLFLFLTHTHKDAA